MMKRINDAWENSLVNATIKASANISADFFFIEVGAGNGIQDDLLFKYIKKYNWRGIFVEPVKYVFDELVNNYKDFNNIRFENIAISDKDETRDFYYVKQNDGRLPPWYKLIGSFYPKMLEEYKYRIPNINDYVAIEKVRCITFSDLLEKNNINKLDMLVIDTEGHDYSILNSIPYKLIKPKIIWYEHKHLDFHDQQNALNLLKNNKYRIIRQDSETFAFHASNGLYILIYMLAFLDIIKKALHKIVPRQSQNILLFI